MKQPSEAPGNAARRGGGADLSPVAGVWRGSGSGGAGVGAERRRREASAARQRAGAERVPASATERRQWPPVPGEVGPRPLEMVVGAPGSMPV